MLFVEALSFDWFFNFFRSHVHASSLLRALRLLACVLRQPTVSQGFTAGKRCIAETNWDEVCVFHSEAWCFLTTLLSLFLFSLSFSLVARLALSLIVVIECFIFFEGEDTQRNSEVSHYQMHRHHEVVLVGTSVGLPPIYKSRRRTWPSGSSSWPQQKR